MGSNFAALTAVDKHWEASQRAQESLCRRRRLLRRLLAPLQAIDPDVRGNSGKKHLVDLREAS